MQVAAGTLVGTLTAAKAALTSGEKGDPEEEESGTVAEKSRRILREAGVPTR